MCDGPLLVRLVGKNVSELTAAELLCALWTRHGATLHDLTTPGDAQLNHNHHRAATRAPAGTITSIVIIIIIGRPREHLLEPSRASSSSSSSGGHESTCWNHHEHHHHHHHHRAARRAGRGARKQQLHVSRDDNKTARQLADHDNDNASLTVAAIYTVYSFNNSVKINRFL